MCYVSIAFYLDVISVDIHDDKEEELDKNENGIICSICLLIRNNLVMAAYIMYENTYT